MVKFLDVNKIYCLTQVLPGFIKTYIIKILGRTTVIKLTYASYFNNPESVRFDDRAKRKIRI